MFANPLQKTTYHCDSSDGELIVDQLLVLLPSLRDSCPSEELFAAVKRTIKSAARNDSNENTKKTMSKYNDALHIYNDYTDLVVQPTPEWEEMSDLVKIRIQQLLDTESVDGGPSVQRVAFVEQKVTHYYVQDAPLQEKKETQFEFVTKSLPKKEKKVDLLYEICIKICYTPLLLQVDENREDLLEFVFNIFGLTRDIHDEYIKNIPEYYNYKNLKSELLILKQEICNKPEADFENKEVQENWINDNTLIIDQYLNNMEGYEDISIDDTVILDIDSRYTYYKQLFWCLFLRDHTIIKKNEEQSLEIDTILTKVIHLCKNDATWEEIQLYLNDEELSKLLVLSEDSKWLLNEYAYRYGITNIYRNLVYISYMTTNIYTTHIMGLIFVQLEKFIYNINATKSRFEDIYVEQVLEKLKNETLKYFSNIFRYYPMQKPIRGFEILLKIVKDIYVVDDILTGSETKFKLVLRENICKSFRNHYKELLYLVESSKNHADRVKKSRPSYLTSSSRELTPHQLSMMVDVIKKEIPNVNRFQNILKEANTNLRDLGEIEYTRLLGSDTSYFSKKYASSFTAKSILKMGLNFYEKLGVVKSTGEVLPLGAIFYTHAETWMVETEKDLEQQVILLCGRDQWNYIVGKRYSESIFIIFEKCMKFLKMATMIGKMLETDPKHKRAQETYLNQYGHVVVRILKKYIEQSYNFFLRDFPEELHSVLHEVYLKEYSDVSSLVKRVGKRNSLTRSKSSSKIVRPQTILHGLEDLRLWEVKEISQKKYAKYTSKRNKTEIKSMSCVKVSNITYLRKRAHEFVQNIPGDTAKFDELNGLCYRVHNGFICMIIQSMNVYVTEQIDYIILKNKKKTTNRTFQEVEFLMDYVKRQMNKMSKYFGNLMFRRFAKRVLRIIIKDFSVYCTLESTNGPLTITQYLLAEYILNNTGDYFLNILPHEDIFPHLEETLDNFIYGFDKSVIDLDEKRNMFLENRLKSFEAIKKYSHKKSSSKKRYSAGFIDKETAYEQLIKEEEESLSDNSDFLASYSSDDEKMTQRRMKRSQSMSELKRNKLLK
eukprot:TRINITY_DN7063_c0_g2_i2.p1 TRINITY_DN7063_c0_g2~~TRINITY_DN7063_c0_g2_i2.p1  ORF type:complete len:1056 (+),score=222.99 TRINITY_DN7063_c0_g2_i2:62-3229(+)